VPIPFLDPNNIVSSGNHPSPPHKLSSSIRTFGYLPDTKSWRPGDLILISEIDPDLISRTIINVQNKLGFLHHHSQWHHAAIYLGDDYLCEATIKGVRHFPIYKYVGSHLIKIRRDSSLDLNDSYRIAIQGLLRLRYRYSLPSIFRLFWQSNILQSKIWQSKRNFLKSNFEPRKLSSRATICSQLYADAFGSITQKTLDADFTLPMTPAALSASHMLFDLPDPTWLKLNPTPS
jgi:hypothetical protein